MAFPTNPTDGQLYTLGDRTFAFNATLGVWRVYAAPSTRSVVQTGGAAIIASADDLATDSVANGTFSFDSNDKVLYVFDGNEWVDPVTKTAISLSSSYVIPEDFSNVTELSSGTGSVGNLGISIDGLSGAIIAENTDVSDYITFGTAFDSSTASSTRISVFLNNYGIYSAQWSKDGTQVLFGHGGFGIVNKTVSTPFDTRTITGSQSYNTDRSGNRSVGWCADGLGFFYRGGFQGNEWWLVTLNTPYDISDVNTVTTTTLSGTDEGSGTPATDGWISSDGSYIICRTGLTVRKITLTTPYDMSTASIANIATLPGSVGSVTGWAFSFDGTKMFVNGNGFLKTFSL